MNGVASLGTAQKWSADGDGLTFESSSQVAECLAQTVCHLYRVTPMKVRGVEDICDSLERNCRMSGCWPASAS